MSKRAKQRRAGRRRGGHGTPDDARRAGHPTPPRTTPFPANRPFRMPFRPRLPFGAEIPRRRIRMRSEGARENMLEVAIGREVRAFRKKLGITVADLAGADRHVARHAVEDRERRHLAVADDAAGAVAGARRSGHRLLPPLRGGAQRRLRQGRRGPRRRAARHARRPPVPSARPYRLQHQRRRRRALSDHADRGFGRVPDSSSMRAWNSSTCWRARSCTATATSSTRCSPATACSSTPTRRTGRRSCEAADPLPLGHLLRARRGLIDRDGHPEAETEPNGPTATQRP